MVERFAIFLVELEWGDCRDARPCLVLSPDDQIRDHPEADVLVALMSGQLDLYDRELHFLIDSSVSSFGRTGLKRSSFVALNVITHVQASELKKQLGYFPEDLQGGFRDALRAYLGL